MHEGVPQEEQNTQPIESQDEDNMNKEATVKVITPESVVATLKEGDVSQLIEYRKALEESMGETTEGRFDLEEIMIRLYVAAGMHDEALDTVDAMLDMADGERNDAQYERFRAMGMEISALLSQNNMPIETPRTDN